MRDTDLSNIDQYVSRRHTIGDKRILVLDDIFAEDEVKSLHTFLLRLPYRLTEIDTPESSHNRNWAASLPVAMAAGTPVLSRCVQLAREFNATQSLELRRAYVNFNRYGDMQYAHVDAEDGVTALYYANSEWKEHWGGETVFYDANREPVYLVIPRPGRLVLFDPSLLHRGGVPSRDCWEARLAVAFKLLPAA